MLEMTHQVIPLKILLNQGDSISGFLATLRTRKTKAGLRLSTRKWNRKWNRTLSSKLNGLELGTAILAKNLNPKGLGFFNARSEGGSG